MVRRLKGVREGFGGGARQRPGRINQHFMILALTTYVLKFIHFAFVVLLCFVSRNYYRKLVKVYTVLLFIL